jgi:response regulator NasT
VVGKRIVLADLPRGYTSVRTCKNAALQRKWCMGENPLHILIIDPNRLRASIIEDGLREAGHEKVTLLDDTSQAIERIVKIDPDVIFIDLENPNRDELEHMFQVSRAVKRPVAMFVDRTDQASIEAAVTRFGLFERMRRELEEARSELADRKTIDRAKAILMRSRGLTEPEAYALMRRAAMNQSKRIVEIAESLITAAGLLEDGEAQ